MDSNGIGDLGKFNFMDKGMYPMSQIDRSYYATPTQIPLAAQAAQSDYDPAINPLTGEPVSRFASGGIADIPRFSGKFGSSVFEDDPNNFASDITKAYKSLLGRDPSEQELRVNVDALNKNPDAFGFVVDKLANDPNAAKFHADDAKPIIDDQGNPVLNEDGQPMMTSAYDPEAAAQQLYAGYGKWLPREEPGGFQGIMNKYGPYLPLAMAAAAYAGPALFGEAALEGVTIGAPIAEPVIGVTSIAPEVATAGSGSWGLTPELAAELGLSGSTTGLSGAGASGDVLAGMGIEGAGSGIGELSAKDALMAKLGLDMVTGGSGGQGGTGSSTTTTSTPFATNQTPYSLQYNPTPQNNVFTAAGMTNEGYYGYKPTTYGYDYGIKPLSLRAPDLSLKYRGYAEGGIADLGGYAAGGKLLKGPGDGMSDSIVANIGGKQPARLADGEFVIPADVVSHLGNGSTDAGARQLYKMMDRIRHARTGNKKQGKQINPSKFLPKG